MIPDILEQLHSTHQGGGKMKLRARSTVFWTDITKDIDNTVSRCTQCQESQPRQRQEPMTPSEVPPRAWHTVRADLFTLNGEYLIVADYYSKYPFVFKLSSTESYSIVEKVKNLFSEQDSGEAPWGLVANRSLTFLRSALLQCLQFPAWQHCLLPGGVYGSLPGNICQCLPGHVCSPCLGSLPVLCLGTLASSLPGDTCQFPAWEHLPVPCLGTFCSPCLGRFASSLPGHVCQFPALA